MVNRMAIKKVPEYIKKKMHTIARLERKSSEIMEEIENWLIKNGMDVSVDDGLRHGDGIGLDELEYGNDCTDELCERIETGEW